MNKLYGILLGAVNTTSDYSWYAKNYTTVPLSERGMKLRASFISGLEEASVALFASLVCYLGLLSPYGKEIQNLDANNTYVQPSRPDGKDSSDPLYCASSLIKPARQYESSIDLLDEDIKERLDYESFISIAGAVCLQLLREVIE